MCAGAFARIWSTFRVFSFTNKYFYIARASSIQNHGFESVIFPLLNGQDAWSVIIIPCVRLPTGMYNLPLHEISTVSRINLHQSKTGDFAVHDWYFVYFLLRIHTQRQICIYIYDVSMLMRWYRKKQRIADEYLKWSGVNFTTCVNFELPLAKYICWFMLCMVYRGKCI